MEGVFLSFVTIANVEGARCIYAGARESLYVVSRSRDDEGIFSDVEEGSEHAYGEVCHSFEGCLMPGESLSLWVDVGGSRERCVWAAGGSSSEVLVGLTAWEDWSNKTGGAYMVVRELSGLGHLVLASASAGSTANPTTHPQGGLSALSAMLLREKEHLERHAKERKYLSLMRLGCDDAWLLDLQRHSRLALLGSGEVAEVPWQTSVAPQDNALLRREIDGLLDGKKKRAVINLRYGPGYTWHELAARITARDEAGVPTEVGAIVRSIEDRYQAEQEMRRSEELRERILDQVPAIVVFCDQQGQHQFINDTGLRYLGLESYADLAGVNFFDNPFISEAQKALIRGNDNCSFDVDYDFDSPQAQGYHRSKRHGVANITMRISRLHANGKDDGFMVVCTDNSSTIMAERRERLLRDFFDEVGRDAKIGVCEFGPGGFTSEQWKANLGVLPDDRDPLGSLSEEEQVEMRTIIEQMRQRQLESYEGNVEIPQADGVHTIRLQLMRGRGGAVTGLSTDVTADERRNETLTKALRKAEQLESLRGQFLNNVSHEMRTPLNAIIGFSDLIADRVGGELAQYADIVRTNNARLLRVMDGVMELASIQSGEKRVNMAQIPLSTVLKVVGRRTAELPKNAHSQAVRYIESLPAEYAETEVCTDPLIVAQIAEHLVCNALEHTYEGEVNTWIDCAGDDWTLHVSDTGCGIPREKQEVIFDPFVKLDNFSQGAGLGLALCRGLADLLGATLTIVSTPDVGSHFKLTAPRERTFEELPPQRTAVVLSDDSALGVHVSLMLPEFEVVSVGADAYSRAVLEKDPELVLIDARCCTEAALKFIGNARRNHEERRILVLNGPHTALDDQTLHDEGADAVLSAPIAVVELWRAIKTLVRAVSPRPSSWEHIA